MVPISWHWYQSDLHLCIHSVDSFDREIQEMDTHAKNRGLFWKRANRAFDAAFTKFCPKVISILKVVRRNALSSQMIYIKIMPRNWWHSLSWQLARRIDAYITRVLRQHFRVRELWVQEVMTEDSTLDNKVIMLGMLTTDEVHLNNYGHMGFIMALVRPLLGLWLAYLRKNGPKVVKKKCKVRRRSKAHKAASIVG